MRVDSIGLYLNTWSPIRTVWEGLEGCGLVGGGWGWALKVQKTHTISSLFLCLVDQVVLDLSYCSRAMRACLCFLL